MTISEQAIAGISNAQARLKLALALKVSERWIVEAIKLNKDDGILTKAKALRVIAEETGLDESEILLEEVGSVTTK